LSRALLKFLQLLSSNSPSFFTYFNLFLRVLSEKWIFFSKNPSPIVQRCYFGLLYAHFLSTGKENEKLRFILWLSIKWQFEWHKNKGSSTYEKKLDRVAELGTFIGRGGASWFFRMDR
jgi:hypothetical protein